MAIKRASLISSIIILAGIIGGCAIGNKVETNYTRSISVGREMTDLKEALDKGAITQEEYEKLKTEVMKNETFTFSCKSDKNKKCCKKIEIPVK